jgi:hypothetical protein
MILTPDNEYSVVLDACVLAPMPLCDTLLRLAEEPGLYRPLWGEEILREVSDTILKGDESWINLIIRLQTSNKIGHVS